MKLSFVIPTFNAGAWLPHAVESCQKQKYPDIEIVIVDDCSTDSTSDYLNWLKAQDQRVDQKIRIIHNEKNMGRSASRNIGNLAASGDAILVLDADDIAYPNRAALTAKKLMQGYQYVYGGMDVIDAIGFHKGVMTPDTVSLEKVLKDSHKQVGIVHSSAAYTKALAEKYQCLEGDAARLGIDDWSQQVRMMADGVKFDFIPQVVGAYRILSSAITYNRDMGQVLACKEKLLEEIGVAKVAA